MNNHALQTIGPAATGDMMNAVMIADELKQAREEFHQEWIQLQVVGRELTPDEQSRSQILEKVLRLLDEALIALGG
jgi:hypothetical protein